MNSSIFFSSDAGIRKPDLHQIQPGTVIVVRQGKKDQEYFVYDIRQTTQKMLYDCLKIKHLPDGSQNKHHPEFYYLLGDRIILYSVLVEIASDQIYYISFKTEPDKARQIISNERGYLIRNRVPKNTRTRFNLVTKPEKKKTLKKNTGSFPIANADKYSVTDRIIPGSNGVCPVCHSRIYSKQYNIPAYDSGGNFHAYYIASLFHCPLCHTQFMSEKEFHDLTNRVNAAAPQSHVRPQNMTKRYDSVSHAYLYAPIATEISLFKSVRPKTEKAPAGQSWSGSEEQLALNDSSFLADMGYSTSLSTNDRRKILDNAVRQYGRRKVADHIRFLIRMRELQSSGAIRYANAISIWQDDLNYIASGRS